MNILNVNDLNVYYGGIHAIKNISFQIKKGEIVSLIGANGAGKTSTLHAISGLVPIKSGEISLSGENVTNIDAYKLVSRVMAHVPEGRRIFTELTVLEKTAGRNNEWRRTANVGNGKSLNVKSFTTVAR